MMSNKKHNLKNKDSTLNVSTTHDSRLKTKNNKANLMVNLPVKSNNSDLTINQYKSHLAIKPSMLSAKEFPNASKQWINSVYSFNSNYIKNIPSADKILNKIIKSFFNLNPLAKNANGKKSKLLKRRFRRLSLNKLFLSRSEIKHSNDKVHVTVYLFNKKKSSLIYKINNLFSFLSFEPSDNEPLDLNTLKGRRLSSIKFKYFNSESLKPRAKKKGKWLKSIKTTSVLQKLNSINKKYAGITLKFLNKIHKNYLKISSKKLNVFISKQIKNKKNMSHVLSNVKKKSNHITLKKAIFLLNLRFIRLRLLNKNRNKSILGKLALNKIKPKFAWKISTRPLKKRVLFKSYKKLFENVALRRRSSRFFRMWRKNKYQVNKNRFLAFASKNKNNINNKNRFLAFASKNKINNKNTFFALNKHLNNNNLKNRSRQNNSNFKSSKRFNKGFYYLDLKPSKTLNIKPNHNNLDLKPKKILSASTKKQVNKNMKFKLNKTLNKKLGFYTLHIKPKKIINKKHINKNMKFKLNKKINSMRSYILKIKQSKRFNNKLAYYNVIYKHFKTNTKKNRNFANTLLNLKRRRRVLIKFNKSRFIKPKNSFTLKVILNKSKNFLTKNISNINSNYIKYLEIKQKRSSLKTISRKTRNLTSNKYKKLFLFRKNDLHYDFINLHNKKIQNYKELNNITRNSIYKSFTNKLLRLNKENALPIVKNYYNNFNKYKLYKLSSAQKKNPKLFNTKMNKHTIVLQNKTFKTSLNKINLFTSNNMPTMSMHKLKELYKLFTLYNNRTNLRLQSSTQKLASNNLCNTKVKSLNNTSSLAFKSNDLELAQNKSLNTSLTLAPNTMSSKLLINTHKLFKNSLGIIVKTNDKSLYKLSPTYKKKSLMWKKKKLNQKKKNQISNNKNFLNRNNKNFNRNNNLNLSTPNKKYTNLNKFNNKKNLNNNKSLMQDKKQLNSAYLNNKINRNLKRNNKKLNGITSNKKYFLNRNNQYLMLNNKKKIKQDKKLVLANKLNQYTTQKKYNLKALITFKRAYRKKRMNNNVGAHNTKILIYFNKIDRFVTTYLENYLPLISTELRDKLHVTQFSTDSIMPNKELGSNISASYLRNIYKLKIVKLMLQHELIYLNYIKLLSFNNALLKNWFIHNLKNTISKIYNKNVILNIVNLKNIHLNSDILMQAIKIKLNKFRKNRVKRVLKLIINKIKISKINRQFFNLNHNEYKNLLLHINNYKTLNSDIFKDLNTDLLSNKKHNTNKKNKSLALKTKKLIYYKRPSKLKALNAIQYNTINFTKYKSVSGVRVQAAGRLTKRSTAARSILSLRYAGSLRNNVLINNRKPSILLKNNKISNLQFTKISSKTRNGSFGIKGWISSN